MKENMDFEEGTKIGKRGRRTKNKGSQFQAFTGEME